MVFVVVVVATDTDTDNELGFFEGVIIVNGESLPPPPSLLSLPHSDCEAGRSPRTSKLEKRGGCPLELAIDFFEVTVPALALAFVTHPAPTPEIEAELAGCTAVVPTLEDHDANGGDVVTVAGAGAGAGEVVVVVVVCVTAVSAEVESDERRRPR